MPLALSILVRPDWLGVAVRLRTQEERFQLAASDAAAGVQLLEGRALDAALQRLAAAETSATVMVNNPLYRLQDLAVGRRQLQATLTLTEFADYALTMDLLETELVDALAGGGHGGGDGRGGLPLRDTYLPSVASALAFRDRLCVGGPVALLAAARPAARHGQREPDYVLLVQERSVRVLNVTGRLAVVPKAFHGPTTEAAQEAHLSASLERELEEELLGRQDLEQVAERSFRRVDPFHTRSARRTDALARGAARDRRLPPGVPRLWHQPGDRERRVPLPDPHRRPAVVGALQRPDRSQLGDGPSPPLLVSRHHRPASPRARLQVEQRGSVRLPRGPAAARRTRYPCRASLCRRSRWGSDGGQLVCRQRSHRQQGHRGWIIGHFLDQADGVRAADEVEIKWGVHPAGEARHDWQTDEHRTTVIILVSGQSRVELSTGTFVLKDQGEYAMWGRGIDHSWQAEEDSIIIAVRWPSISTPTGVRDLHGRLRSW